MPEIQTAEPALRLKTIIVERIKRNDAENDQLRKALEALQYLPADMSAGEMPFELLPPDPAPATVPAPKPVTEEIDNAVLKDYLVQIAREYGKISFVKLPRLFQAKGWMTTLDSGSLISTATTIVRSEDSLFEQPLRGYFKLATDNGKETTKTARNFHPKPLIELAYDALKRSPTRQLPLSNIAKYAKEQKYVSNATTPMNYLISSVLSHDRRFINVERGVWKLRANS